MCILFDAFLFFVLFFSCTITTSVTSKLHLVDLAGSERAKKTMAQGEQFAEVNNYKTIRIHKSRLIRVL